MSSAALSLFYGQLGSGSVYVRAFLASSGSSQCVLSNITLTGNW